jgi:hypothetical protein
MKKIISVLFISIFLICGHANAQELWNGTKAGMSPAEVKRIHPKCLKTLEKYGNNHTALLVLNDIKVSYISLKVHFIFDANKKLEMVRMYIEDKTKIDITTFNELETNLITKYGQPIQKIREINSVGTEVESVWKKENKLIRLYYIIFIIDKHSKDGIHKVLGLNYTEKPESSNL